jgi:hypothetical protein
VVVLAQCEGQRLYQDPTIDISASAVIGPLITFAARWTAN